MTTLKTVFFVLLVPGFLLGVVPVWLVPQIGGLALPAGIWNWLAVPFWLAGAVIMIWCARDFVIKGRGTPMPLDPPKELVIQGLYRYSRNPMYVGALLIQAGNLLWFGALAQAVYWGFLAIGFYLFVTSYEEPHLRKTFGAAYADYCARVRRWL